MTQRRILFVCLGNICRSPSAEGVFRHLVEEAGLAEQILIDSAGTGDWHVGDLADPRMRQAAAGRGYDLTSRARQVSAPVDFEHFDYVIPMDSQNERDLRALPGAAAHADRIRRMTTWCRRFSITEVPDPYFGGEAGFQHVLDILEDACAELLVEVQADLARES